MSQKSITIFGAGLVAKPVVDYLASHGFKITVADIVESNALALTAPYKNACGVGFDSSDITHTEKLIKESDLAISMLPATMHPMIAELCIKHKKNMVTASYVSPVMKAFDADARKADIVILNEIGVDPGIDHMSAMKIFDEVKEKGGKITEFFSYCGGLPEHTANTNPLGYKFSWAPKGVLLAACNNAKYLRDNKVVDIPGKELFGHYWLVDVPGAGTYEAYPNRDSLSYVDTYNLQGINTMYRGTFRNVSHCDTWWSFSQLDFYNNEDKYDKLTGTVRDFIADKMFACDKADLEARIAKLLGIKENSIVMKKFAWLGFFDETPIPIKSGTPIDVLTALMLEKMPYTEGEVDMLLMHHRFTAEINGKTQHITSTLVDYGIKGGDSSMSRTVGLPAAIGARMILEGKIISKGVIIPIAKDIYEPVLNELEKMNICMIEAWL